MINLTHEELEKKEKLEELIEQEKQEILLMLDVQNLKRSTLKDALDKIEKFFKKNNNELSERTEIILINLKNSLALSETNIYVLSNLLNDLNDFDSILNKYTNEKVKEVEKYNKRFEEADKIITNNTVQIEKTLNNIATFSELIFEDIVVPVRKVNESKKSKYAIDKKELKVFDLKKYPENTLKVSEKENLVYLPFYIDELNDIYMENKERYTGFKAVLDDKYTVSLDNYKNPAISRFKEAFKLMRIKENATVLKSLELGLELFFNYNLHPAIITASRSLEELRKYLNLLEESKTQHFDGFRIIFDMAPIEIKSNLGVKEKITVNNETVEEILEVELESKTIDIEDIKEEEKAKRKFDTDVKVATLNIEELEEKMDPEPDIEKIVIPNEAVIRRNEDYNLYSEEERKKLSLKKKKGKKEMTT